MKPPKKTAVRKFPVRSPKAITFSAAPSPLDQDDHRPVRILTSSVIAEKMRAIEMTAKAVYEVAKALNSVNLNANISYNHISNTAGPGIQITHE